MKRNSTTLFLVSPGAITPVPWVDNAPDFSGFTEPTLSVLQSSWSSFLDSGEALEIVPDPQPTAGQVYNPAQFLQEMFASASFEAWLSNFSVFKQSGFMNAATNAKVDDNWQVVQAVYDQLKAGVTPSQSGMNEWQSYADENGIPFVF